MEGAQVGLTLKPPTVMGVLRVKSNSKTFTLIRVEVASKAKIRESRVVGRPRLVCFKRVMVPLQEM